MNAKMNRAQFCLRAVLATGLAVLAGCHAKQHRTLTLSVAASLTDAINEIESGYKSDRPLVDFRNNFGSSGMLAGQIEQGAPVDVFLSAAAKPMDDLEAKGRVNANTRRTLLRNSLVLIAPPDSELKDFQGLTDRSIRAVALGDPASVPAGHYGKQTLTSLHLYDKLSSRLVFGKDVRQVLSYVETGNADAGLVYATDALISHKVKLIAAAPESSHDAIVYPVAVMKGSRNEQAAREFVEYLSGPAAQSVFQKYGFTIAAQ